MDLDPKQDSETSSPDITTPSAWKLSPRSKLCLSQLLSSCPELGRVGVSQEDVSAKREAGSRERVNLDITTLIKLVSNICHGRCRFHFLEKVLDEQAAEEREQPSLPLLMEFLRDKDWVVCCTAWSNFNSIVEILGGLREKERAAQLVNRVTIVDDKMSARAAGLKLNGKIKETSKIVFGTGDELHAITVTANSGFVRAAKSQAVSFVVHMHLARALTEQKEATATPL